MSPEVVVESANSPPAVWKVSRQRPRLGLLAFFTISQTCFQVGYRYKVSMLFFLEQRGLRRGLSREVFQERKGVDRGERRDSQHA